LLPGSNITKASLVNGKKKTRYASSNNPYRLIRK
jgi:hypothetical protein